jgi:AcrR family transcriptional regulator
MTVNRQAARSASTRAGLVKAARSLFARKGYAAVGTEEIVRRAGVTRGALYHQFKTKEELFLAVYEQVEEELTRRVVGSLGDVAGPFAALRAGLRIFLEQCSAPGVQRIVMIDGPSVLGWERWREVAERNALGLLVAEIGAAIEAGEMVPVAAEPLAHILMGALDEAALLVVREPASMEDVAAALECLVDGLRKA